MTIPEYAKSKGKSKQAIYQKLTASGIDKSILLDEKGNLTEKGIQQLDSIMQKQAKKRSVKKTVNHSSDELQAVIKAKEAEIEALQNQITVLSGQCDEWHKLFIAENQKNDTMTETIRQLSLDLAQAQALHATDKQKRLLSGDGNLFTRLFKKK